MVDLDWVVKIWEDALAQVLSNFICFVFSFIVTAFVTWFKKRLSRKNPKRKRGKRKR